MIINFFRETSHFVRRILNTSFNFKFHLLIFTFSLLILTRFNIDPDLGWHLAYGNRFLETGEIIRSDQFSWTTPGFVWGNSYFLYQILTAFLFDNLGYVKTAFFYGAIVAFSILLILPKKLNLWSSLVVFLGGAIALANVGIRPHNLDWPFFSLLLILLWAKAYKKLVFLGFWFVFFALWANIHVGFVFGLVIFIGIVIVDLLLSPHKHFWRTTLVILAAFSGTFLTPFHYQLWKSIFLDSAGLVGWSNIAALQSTAIVAPYNIFLALSGTVFMLMLFSRATKFDFSWFLMASFTFLLAFFVVDFVYIWVIVFMFLGVRFFERGTDFWPVHLELSKDRFAKLGLYLPAFCAILALVLNFFVNLIESTNLKARFIRDGYPVEAVRFLEDNNLGQNLFNEYAWGGYLDWQVPSVRVFIDGRMTGWKKSAAGPEGLWPGGNDGYILADYLAITKGDCEVARRWQIKTVLVEASGDNPCFADFREVYRDSVAKVLIKV